MRCYLPIALVLALFSVSCESDNAASPSPATATATVKFAEAQAKQTKALVDNFAYNAYPQWAVSNTQSCPKSLDDLAPLINKKSVDSAGVSLVMLCGDDAPSEANGFGVLSVGADGVLRSADDISSWKPL